MASFTRDDAITRVYRMLRDVGNTATEQLLTNTEIGDFVDQAARRYSLVRPNTIVVDQVADGTNLMDVPAGLDVDFGRIVTIETPTGETPPAFRDPRLYQLYQSPSGWQINWLDFYPTSGDTVRIAYTAARTFEALAADTTVADADYDAVASLAASFCALAISAKYARTSEPQLAADTVNYRTKAQEWATISAKWKAVWDTHAGAIAAPASGTVNWDSTLGVLPYGHLTHPRLRR